MSTRSLLAARNNVVLIPPYCLVYEIVLGVIEVSLEVRRIFRALHEGLEGFFEVRGNFVLGNNRLLMIVCVVDKKTPSLQH